MRHFAKVLLGALLCLCVLTPQVRATEEVPAPEQEAPIQEEKPEPEPEPAPAPPMLRQRAQVIQLTLASYRITPNKIKVKAGQLVKFVVTNKSKHEHEFMIPDLNVQTPRLKPGQSHTLEVTFTRSGTFEGICDVDNHHKRGMKTVIEVD